ncbi:dephospho-CoA kinase [Myxococcota bacterium]|nr:dephospho-CoA kinase [Myxococcota bacterium]MBU1535700.1 dephospho-CoA kinase [Myxococcota bacterium]
MPVLDRPPRTIGVTGGIGSGKSTFSKMLASLGGIHLDGDQLARKAVEPGSEGLRQVRDRFGPQILMDDGTLNRRALGALVFCDHAALADLEAILHPLIGDLLKATIKTGPYPIIYEATLLFEAGHHHFTDLTVTVVAPREITLARVAIRDSLGVPQIRDRLNSQHDDSYRLNLSDIAVHNNNDLESLEQKARTLHGDILRGSFKSVY